MKPLLLSIPLFAFTLTAHASTKESRTAGEDTYHTAGCQQCHGADWTGTDKGPDLRGVGKRMNHSEIHNQIYAGGGGMPPFGEALTSDQITQLVDFLQAQKKAPKPSKHPTQPAPAAAPKPKSDDSE